MPSDRIIKFAVFLLITPPLLAMVWITQQKNAELRAKPGYQLPGQVLMLYSPRCSGCNSMVEVAKDLQAEGFSLKSIDIDDNPSARAQYSVQGVPTFIYLVDGKERYRVQSMLSRAVLEDFCRGINRMAVAGF